MPSSRKNCWKTKPIARARSAASARSLERRGVLAGDVHLARRLALERAHHVQQRRLARARRPYDRDGLALVHGQRDAAQRLHAAGIGLVDGVEPQHGGHCAVTTCLALAQAVALDLDHVVGVEAGRDPDHAAAAGELDRVAAALAREQRLHRHRERAAAALDREADVDRRLVEIPGAAARS